jgi:hypothetical protein
MKEAARLKTIEINPRTNILEIDINRYNGTKRKLCCGGV